MDKKLLVILGIFLILNVSAISWGGGGGTTIINQSILEGNLTNLSQMADVEVGNPPDDDNILSWDSTLQKWINKTMNTIISFGDNWNYWNGANEFTFNETKLNNTIDQKIATIEYNASRIDTLTGTLDSGNLASVLIRDDLFYNVSEVGGSPGFIIQLNFTEIPNFNSIVTRLNYEGSSVHIVMIELWDCVGQVYDEEHSFADTDGVVDIIHEVLDASDHICGLDQNVSVQITHQSTGNPSHDIFIDGLHLVKGATVASPSEIDPLAIHSSGDVPLSGNWDVGAKNITNISYGQIGNLWICNYTLTSNLTKSIADGDC